MVYSICTVIRVADIRVQLCGVKISVNLDGVNSFVYSQLQLCE